MNAEYEFEPVPGLPAELPEGERLLWQGSPQWISIARHVFHTGLVASYFAVLAGWRLFAAYWTGDDLMVAGTSALWIGIVATVALGLIALLAWLTARTTIYSITSRRVLMRYGIALPLTVNLPFSSITTADIGLNRDGTGNIALTLNGDGKLAYLHLWPHARAWHLKDPQPVLRSLVDPSSVANLLSKAMTDVMPEASRTPVLAASANPAAAAGGDMTYGTASA